MALFTLVLSFLTILFIIFPKSSSAPTYIVSDCPNTTFVTKSPYQTNLNTVFHYLSSNATSSFGFHEALAGKGTNEMVYGNFLCRGDQSPDSCQDCVTTATTTDLPKTCPNRKVATIWYDECTVRYSNESFFGMMDKGGFLLHNVQNITGNITQFMDIVNSTMNDIVTTAANGGPNKKYATGVAQYNSSVTIYGLEQCTPDLSATDCSECLQSSVGSLPISKGGRILGPSCNVRFEVYPFFNGTSNLTLSPSPSPSPLPSPLPSSLPSPPLPSPLPSPTSNSPRRAPLTNSCSGKSKLPTKVIAIIVPVVVLSYIYI